MYTKVGDVVQFKDLNFPLIDYEIVAGMCWSTIDDGRELFFEEGLYGYKAIVLDYREGGKDSDNPKLRILSKWKKEVE